VALNAKTGEYFLTPTGHQAIADAAAPQFLNVEEEKALLLMERMSGCLINSEEAEARYKRAPVDFSGEEGPPAKQQLDAEWSSIRVSAAQVEPLLPSPEGKKWLCWIDEPQLAGLNSLWMQADVDTRTGRIYGLSPRWEKVLRPHLYRKAEELTGNTITTTVETLSEIEAVPEGFPVRVETSDLWVTKEQHASALRVALENAESFVHVASAFFKPDAISPATRSAMLNALRRGVRLGLLWGYEQGDAARQAVEWLSALSREVAEHNLHFWYNRTASDSHAKLLAWDEEGQPRVVLGSCNWLSTAEHVTEGTRANISFSVRDARVVAPLLRAFAGLWRQTSVEGWHPAMEDLFQRATSLSEQISLGTLVENAAEPNATLRIVSDRDHEIEMRSLLLSARRRCWIASHKLAPNATSRLASLAPAQQLGTIETKVNYELHYLDQVQLDYIHEHIRNAGGVLAQRERFHAKCIVADDSSLISSFNFLSANPFGTGRIARELGILIENSDVADRLWAEA
jgi:phosphatidylserine/phosphatidylglycerophosphate/cardiolipin synthase-like enzyme